MDDVAKCMTRSASSFMGIRQTSNLEEIDAHACIVGIPFDCGSHPFRIGARQGPDAIRQQSALLRPYRSDVRYGPANPIESLGLFDLGNVACTPGNIEASFPAIESAIDAVITRGMIPISMGGDGAVTLPQLRAASRHYEDLVVLHFDAHTDTTPLSGYNTATTFTRAAEEKLIDASSSFHIGARGLTFMPDVLKFTASVGYEVIPFSDFTLRQPECLAEIRNTIGNRPTYLCFDMDIFDPSCAPGVCTPEWGGLSAREGLALMRQLAGINFVAFDVNTVSPPQDIGGMTAFLAASVLYECCTLAAVAKMGMTAGD